MALLNQIIAIAGGKKSQAQSKMTEIYHKLQKGGLLDGISRSYRPKDEEGERLPPESKRVQMTVVQALVDAQAVLVPLYDIVATQDAANCEASADVVVDGHTVLSGVPVTTLLFLEKQLVDVGTLIDKLPTLDPGEEWSYSPEADCYATRPSETTRTKKVPKSFVAYEATKEHPAQVQVFNEDVLVGYWSQVKFSGAVPESKRNEWLGRLRKLQDAVKAAREQANSVTVKDKAIGADVFGYLFA